MDARVIRLERRSRVPLPGLVKNSRGAWAWTQPMDHGESNGFAVVAVHELAGRYPVEAGRMQFLMDRRRLVDKGTRVQPGFRRNGIALSLWREAIAWRRPKTAIVAVISSAGMRLVRSLGREYPQIKWTVFDDRQEKSA